MMTQSILPSTKIDHRSRNPYPTSMTFWIDGDSCPRPVRELLIRTALRLGWALKVVANRPLVLAHPGEMILAENREGAADEIVLSQAVPGDVVITRDIPFAARLVDKGILTLNDRGDVFTPDFVRERLSVRNFSLDLRMAGVYQPGKSQYGQKEYQAFARTLDRELVKLARSRP